MIVSVFGQSCQHNLSILNKKWITPKASPRQTKLAVRFCQINLRTPYRFDNRDPQQVYAVYASELDCPDGESPVEWMLLTTEVIAADGFYDFAGTLIAGVLKNTIKFSSQDVRSNIQACGWWDEGFNWFLKCDCCWAFTVDLSPPHSTFSLCLKFLILLNSEF